MLNRNYPLPGVGAFRQRGVVLLISLIVLVVLSMAGLALLRSVDTTSIIAGMFGFSLKEYFRAEEGAKQVPAVKF